MPTTGSVVLDRGISALAAMFAGLATLLAGVGLYGVLSHGVAQRTREIGVRMALGAGRASVRRMILSQVAAVALACAGFGMAAALVAGRFGRALLFELEPHDPLVLIASAAALAIVALAAGLGPAWWASRIDPMRALRYE